MASRDDARLSQISTAWTVLFQAHQNRDADAAAARRDLVTRYSGPVYRYLRASVPDVDAADELYQEFALRFVRGDFRRASPDRGRFRDFLKTVLYHLVVDYRRRTARAPAPLPSDMPTNPDSMTDESDEAFLAAWRSDLIHRAWQELEAYEQSNGLPLYTILRLRTTQPDLSAAEMAERLSGVLHRTVDAAWSRKRLHFARSKFAEILIALVSLTIDSSDPDTLAEELIALRLYEYCRPALRQDRSAQ